MTLKSIEQEWLGFSAMVFDGCQPSDTQVREMEKTFYAGYWSLLAALQEIGEPHIPEAQGEAFLTERFAECDAFHSQLRVPLAQPVSPRASQDPSAENSHTRSNQLRPAKLMQDMTEPELSQHLRRQLDFIKAAQTPDTIGSMLIIFQDNGITQYGATVDPTATPQALRELADRLERREAVTREGN
jgi:hypothetical protein